MSILHAYFIIQLPVHVCIGNIFVWEYQDDQQCKHSVLYDKIKNGVSRECFVFCKIEKFGYFNKHGVSEDKLIKK